MSDVDECDGERSEIEADNADDQSQVPKRSVSGAAVALTASKYLPLQIGLGTVVDFLNGILGKFG